MSTATLDTTTSERTAETPVMLAVSYLRVSTRERKPSAAAPTKASRSPPARGQREEGRRAGPRGEIHRRRRISALSGS